jgi:hypothetical protein
VGNAIFIAAQTEICELNELHFRHHESHHSAKSHSLNYSEDTLLRYLFARKCLTLSLIKTWTLIISAKKNLRVDVQGNSTHKDCSSKGSTLRSRFFGFSEFQIKFNFFQRFYFPVRKTVRGRAGATINNNNFSPFSGIRVLRFRAVCRNRANVLEEF